MVNEIKGFTDRLKMLLKVFKVSQKELATTAGLTEASVCRYLKGIRIPNFTSMIKITNMFKMPLSYLMMDEPVPTFDEMKAEIKKKAGKLTQEQLFDCVELLFRIRAMKYGV